MSPINSEMSPTLAPARSRIHITFIGGGTMACAILDGLADYAFTVSKSGQRSEYSFSITHRRQERVTYLFERYPEAYVTGNNDDKKLWRIPNEDEPAAHIVMICTKPQQTMEVCESIRHAYETLISGVLPTVVTMCPGITIAQLEGWLSPKGSGPAYIFQFYQTLVAAGVEWGLPETLARALVMQTGVGASLLANNQPKISLSSMIGNVCVPGGSTEKGIKRLVDFGLQKAITDAVSTSLEANHSMKGHK